MAETFKVAAIMTVVSFCIYRSLWAFVVMIIPGIFLFKRIEKNKLKKERSDLKTEFKECIQSVLSSLGTGASVENAFMESMDDMELMFGRDSNICRELEVIRRGLVINIPIEELLKDFGSRSFCSEISEFAEVFRIAKRTGGNMKEIMNVTVSAIVGRIETDEEIKLNLAGKRFEFNIMKVMPFLMLLYMNVGYPQYFDLLYNSFSGACIMTGFFSMYIGAVFWGEKILEDIERELE